MRTTNFHRHVEDASKLFAWVHIALVAAKAAVRAENSSSATLSSSKKRKAEHDEIKTVALNI